MQPKKPLKQTTDLRPKKQPKPQSKPNRTKLRLDADEWFSKYVRLRDSERIGDKFVGQCITSGKEMTVCWYDEEKKKWRWTKGSNLGHFVGRGIDGGWHWLRYDEENCNLQSAYDNAWRDKESMISAYKKALDMKYGTGTAKKLIKAGKQHYSLTREDLEQVIHDSKEALAFYIGQV